MPDGPLECHDGWRVEHQGGWEGVPEGLECQRGYGDGGGVPEGGLRASWVGEG